jgi:RNA polymerase sigma factor (sigma-70 family)
MANLTVVRSAVGGPMAEGARVGAGINRVQRVVEGSKGNAVLERTYREHVTRIQRTVRFGLAQARQYSAANQADLVQEVFLKAFSPAARRAYDGRAYGPFLQTIARHVVIDFLRRSTRERVTPDALELMDTNIDEATNDSPYPPEVVRVTETYVNRLSPQLKHVHERRFIAAEPQHIAAKALGISRQSLRTLERKLVDGLRRELAKELPDRARQKPWPIGAR